MSNKQLAGQNIQIKENNIGKWVWSIISLLAISAFPVLFLYFQNADEASFSEVVLPLIIFASSSALFFGLFFLFSKYAPKTAIITSVFMLVLLNYSLLEKGVQIIFPSLRYWHILPIFLFILGHITWFINKKLQTEIADTITFVLCIVFCSLILFNGVTAMPTIIKKIYAERQVKEQKVDAAQMDTENKEFPNIYYLIFDEYSSFDVIKKYYGYDNSEFKDFLLSNNFSVSTDSHNNSIITTTVVTNILALDYVVDDNTPVYEKLLLRQNAKLYQILSEKGYKINPVGDVEFLGFKANSSSKSRKSVTVSGETFRDLLLSKTVIYPFYESDFKGYANTVLETIDYLCTPNNFSEKGIFTIMHLDCPHPPFVFDKNGQRVSDQNHMNHKDKKYYLEQYIYITSQIKEVIESIIQNDPNSVIILQSDHSVRYLEEIELTDKTNILNAVYFQGKSLNIQSLSGLDTLITVLNKLFDLDIPLKG